MPIAAPRDLEAVRTALTGWLARHEPGATDIRVAPLTRPAGGLSSDTIFVDATWTAGAHDHEVSWVLRLPPAGDGLFPEADLEHLARLAARLGATAIPVAPLVVYEADPGVLGAPFLVTERVAGHIVDDTHVRDPWLLGLAPAEQREVHDRLLELLATIHGVEDDLRDVLVDASDAASEVDRWADYVAWASDGAPLPVLRDALAWCRATLPRAAPEPGLLWGDARLGNVVFDDDRRPRAVLDWEMASIGPAESDLAWFLTLHDAQVRIFGGGPVGFPDRDATIAGFEGLLGRPLVDLAWFETFAMLRSTALLVRVAHLFDAAGEGGWLGDDNPMLRLLAGRLA